MVEMILDTEHRLQAGEAIYGSPGGGPPLARPQVGVSKTVIQGILGTKFLIILI